MPAVPQDDVKIGQQGRRQRHISISLRTLEHHLAETHDHVERRAKLVAHIGHKLLLGTPFVVGCLAQSLGQAVETHQLPVGLGQVLQRLRELLLVVARLFQRIEAPLIPAPGPLNRIDQRLQRHQERTFNDPDPGNRDHRQSLSHSRKQTGPDQQDGSEDGGCDQPGRNADEDCARGHG